jgi:hypothetical protein
MVVPRQLAVDQILGEFVVVVVKEWHNMEPVVASSVPEKQRLISRSQNAGTFLLFLFIFYMCTKELQDDLERRMTHCCHPQKIIFFMHICFSTPTRRCLSIF